MRILHLGWGFQPWRAGGLIEYAEDLIEAQTTAGHEIGYFFAGRHNIFLKRPRLKLWKKRGVRMFEILNSPICSGGGSGTRQPVEEVDEPVSERFFSQALDQFKPDIIHIQELFEVPSSLIDLGKARGLPIVMTLHDHYPLCPTLYLIDHTGSSCKRRDVGETCVKCCHHAPQGRRDLVFQTLRYRKPKWLPDSLEAVARTAAYRAWSHLPAASGTAIDDEPARGESPGLSVAFQRRRDINVRRLNNIDRLIAVSSRSKELYQSAGVSEGRFVILPLALRHIDSIQSKAIHGISGPVNFVTLAGCRDRYKGAYVVLEAMERLAQAGLEDRFRLFIYGHLSSEVRDSILSFSNVEYRGSYKVQELDRILEGMHAGIVPSVCEETGPLTGVEMLAKGIPVAGNKIGGIPDYVREGVTGWLNSSNDGAGLAEIMRRIMNDPDEILRLSELIVAHRETIVRAMARHLKEIDEIYRTVLNGTASVPGA